MARESPQVSPLRGKHALLSSLLDCQKKKKKHLSTRFTHKTLIIIYTFVATFNQVIIG
jgi:hypothetical protein